MFVFHTIKVETYFTRIDFKRSRVKRTEMWHLGTLVTVIGGTLDLAVFQVILSQSNTYM